MYKTKYQKELQEIVKILKKEDIDENIDPVHYAKNIWVINKIKEAKGISILAHPNWVYKDGKYHLHQAFYREMIKSSQLDGVEVFGEEKIREHNNMTYLTTLQKINTKKLDAVKKEAGTGYLKIQWKEQEISAKMATVSLQNKSDIKYLAPFGNSDAHDSNHELGERFTLLFVKEKSNKGIISSIKEGLSCAVFKRENKEHQYIGKDALASYSYFLIKEYYPKHLSLKSRLAKLYVDQFLNDISYERKINIVKQKLENYTKRFFT